MKRVTQNKKQKVEKENMLKTYLNLLENDFKIFGKVVEKEKYFLLPQDVTASKQAKLDTFKNSSNYKLTKSTKMMCAKKCAVLVERKIFKKKNLNF